MFNSIKKLSESSLFKTNRLVWGFEDGADADTDVAPESEPPMDIHAALNELNEQVMSKLPENAISLMDDFGLWNEGDIHRLIAFGAHQSIESGMKVEDENMDEVIRYIREHKDDLLTQYGLGKSELELSNRIQDLGSRAAQDEFTKINNGLKEYFVNLGLVDEALEMVRGDAPLYLAFRQYSNNELAKIYREKTKTNPSYRITVQDIRGVARSFIEDESEWVIPILKRAKETAGSTDNLIGDILDKLVPVTPERPLP